MKNSNVQHDPPRLAVRLLELTVRDSVARTGLIGDLHEGFVRRRFRTRPFRCYVWYWTQVLTACLMYTAVRIKPSREEELMIAERRPSLSRRVVMWSSGIWLDFLYGVRMLVKQPGIAGMSIAALTMGIGFPTVMFTLVNGVFTELPVPDANRVVRLFETDIVRGGQRWNVGQHDYAEWVAQQESFEGLGGFTTDDVTLSGGDARPVRSDAAFVTSNALNLLGARPVLGRSFDERDIGEGQHVAILSYGLWQTQFGGDANVLGRSLSVDGTTHIVIGVMPDRFGFPADERLWLPVPLALDGPRAESPDLEVFGRLREGVTLEQARLELETIAARLATAYPQTNQGRSAGAVRYQDGLIDENFRRGLFTMFGAVSFMLVIACVNVTNLLMARAVMRRQEFAVRSALGASRRRVMRQFLVESLTLAGMGGVLGTLLAWLGVKLVNQTVMSFVGLAWVDIDINTDVLLFVFTVVIIGGLFAGMAPAIRASAYDVAAALKASSRGSGRALGSARFGWAAVTVQIALSCALLVASGLLIKGVLKLRAVDSGMPVEEIVTGEVELPREVYRTLEARTQFFESLESGVSSIPAVTSVALTSDIPGTIGYRAPISVEGASAEPTPRAAVLTVTPGFLDVFDVPIMDGRGFDDRDREGSEPVVIVNRRFTELYFETRSPIGHVIRVSQTSRTIVGVVPDLLMGTMEEPDVNGPGVYLPYAQSGNVSMQVMVRTSRDPLSLTDQVRDVLESRDPHLALMQVNRVDRLIAAQTSVFDVFGKLFLGFGVVTLLLAAAGLYGVMSYLVRHRTHEMGVRIALGASKADVVRLATARVALQLFFGLTAGTVLAGLLSNPLSRFFYQVQPWDVVVLALAVLVLTVTAVGASIVPILRATRTDPLITLRLN